MSTDQICAYCEHPARVHIDGVGCCRESIHPVCPCPRFVANTDTETHEVTAQVLAEADRRKSVLEVAVESERAMAGTHLPTDLIPVAPRLPLDLINHPPHYTAHPSGVECIQITEHMNFNIGNAVKYLWRAGLKGAELADLQKARWYVDREIERLSK